MACISILLCCLQANILQYATFIRCRRAIIFLFLDENPNIEEESQFSMKVLRYVRAQF